MSKEIKLTSENVDAVFADCLFRKEEVVNGKPIVEPIAVDGVIHEFRFHPERLKKHQEEIARLVDNLPNIEKGPSFLNLCMTKEGHQWSDHETIEKLVSLGIATNDLKFCLPREMWHVLPGGMPFIIKNLDKKTEPSQTLSPALLKERLHSNEM